MRNVLEADNEKSSSSFTTSFRSDEFSKIDDLLSDLDDDGDEVDEEKNVDDEEEVDEDDYYENIDITDTIHNVNPELLEKYNMEYIKYQNKLYSEIYGIDVL